MNKNSSRRLVVTAAVGTAVTTVVVLGVLNAPEANAASTPYSLQVISDVPSQDGTRCDATFTVGGQQSGQIVGLRFDGQGKGVSNVSNTYLLPAAGSDGRSAFSVNVVDSPSYPSGTYTVSVISASKGPDLPKVKVTFRCPA